jgi:hypothetical protein
MKQWLFLLLFVFPRFAFGEVDPAHAEHFVRQYAAHYRVPPELIAALIDVESPRLLKPVTDSTGDRFVRWWRRLALCTVRQPPIRTNSNWTISCVQQTRRSKKGKRRERYDSRCPTVCFHC